MFLNLSFLGSSFFQLYNSTFPSLPTFDKITIYGQNSGCTISQLWGQNKDILLTTTDSLNNVNGLKVGQYKAGAYKVGTYKVGQYKVNSYSPSWDENTYILASYNGNLNAGNITGINNPITNWLIYRKDPNQNKLTFLNKVDVAKTSYEDFKVLLNNEYTYYLFGQSTTEISAPLISEKVLADYLGYLIINATDNIAYQFDINLESGDMQAEEDYTEFKTNSKYNAFSRGNHNAIAGSVKAIMYDKEKSIYTIEQTNEMLAEFRNFIQSDKEKLIKDRRGRIYKIFTYGYKENQLNDGIKEQIIVSSFSFKECGSV